MAWFRRRRAPQGKPGRRVPGRRRTVVECPCCGSLNVPLVPSRWRRVTCTTCGAVYNSRTLRLVRAGDMPLPPGDEGAAEVREPRPPRPLSGAGAAALPIPQDGSSG